MSDQEGFTPNPATDELYTADIKPEYPTSHQPDLKDPKTAIAYDHAIKKLGLDKLSSAIDFAQLDESKRSIEESHSDFNEAARKEFKTFLLNGNLDQEWTDFWTTREVEWEKLKAYAHSVYVKYENRYDAEALEEIKKMENILEEASIQSQNEIEIFFNGRPNGERERAQYNDYRARRGIGRNPYAERPSDEVLEADRQLVQKAQDELYNKSSR